MGLSKQMKDLFTYSDMSEDFTAFMTVCQTQDNQIRQPPAAQRGEGAVGFASPRAPPPTKAPETAPAGIVAGYTVPVPLDLSTGKRRISVEERA
jgi:hypothetical protein